MTFLTDDFQVIRRTDKAVQIETKGKRVWLPLSAVVETKWGITIPRWLAKARGLYVAPTFTPRYPSARQQHAAEAANSARYWARWNGLSDAEANAYAGRVYAGEVN